MEKAHLIQRGLDLLRKEVHMVLQIIEYVYLC